MLGTAMECDDAPGGEKETAAELRAQPVEYSVRRPVFNYADFNSVHGEALRFNRSLLGVARDAARKRCSGEGCCRRVAGACLRQAVPPPVEMIRQGQYCLPDLLADTIAGLTTCVFHIPQGLAYGMLAGLKPVNGLYTSLIPVFIFAVFGRSRHLSIGTFAVMSLLILDMVEDNYKAYLTRFESANVSAPWNYTDVDYAKLQVAIVGSFAASTMVIGVGLLRLGFFMRYMSDPMLKGFTAAAAVHVVMSQVPLMFGINAPRTGSRFKIIGTLINLSKVFRYTNFVTLGLSASCCTVLYLVKEFLNPIVKKKFKVPLPIELIVIIVTLAISELANLNERFRVAIVGEVPRGLPAPLLPDLGFLPVVFPSAIPIGIVGAAVSMSLCKMYCLQFQYSYDFNEDFAILGVSGLVSSFFQCFFPCTALARNAVVVSVGMKSQIANLISCACMLLVLLAVGPLFSSIPTCVLGSIITVSLISVMGQATELPSIWRTSRIDFSVWVVAAVAVLALDVTLGLAIGIGFALFSVILRTQSPRIAVLGRVGDTDIYKNVLVYTAAKELPGVKIVRFDAPLNFANSENFRNFAVDLATKLTNEETAPGVHTVVFDCSSWVYADIDGVRTVKETYQCLRKCGFRVLFACCKESVRVQLFLGDFFKEVDMSLFFIGLHDAVLFATSFDSAAEAEATVEKPVTSVETADGVELASAAAQNREVRTALL